MHLIAFGQKKLCKVGTILAGHTGDEGFFHVVTYQKEMRAILPVLKTGRARREGEVQAVTGCPVPGLAGYLRPAHNPV
jgi:hypothetical protein